MIAASPSTASPTRPSTPRLLVGVTALLWLLFAAEFPISLQGLGIALVLAMIALDVALGTLTGWLAFVPTSRLDERQTTLRDRAYRIGFRLVGSGVLLMALLGIVGIFVTFAVQGPLLQVPADGLTVRAVTAFLQLLVMSPTVVLAWSMPANNETAGSGNLRLLPFLAVPAVGALWVAAIVAGPVQTATSIQVMGSMSSSEGPCSNFGAVSRLAGGFGGSARLYAEVCSNGKQAYAVGDPSLPRPASIPPEEWAGFTRIPLTSCTPLSSDTDFGNVDTRCTGFIDAAGTLHLTLSGRIRPLPGNLAARDVQVELVVTRDGKVVTFG